MLNARHSKIEARHAGTILITSLSERVMMCSPSYQCICLDVCATYPSGYVRIQIYELQRIGFEPLFVCNDYG